MTGLRRFFERSHFKLWKGRAQTSTNDWHQFYPPSSYGRDCVSPAPPIFTWGKWGAQTKNLRTQTCTNKAQTIDTIFTTIAELEGGLRHPSPSQGNFVITVWKGGAQTKSLRAQTKHKRLTPFSLPSPTWWGWRDGAHRRDHHFKKFNKII